jgi:hypothetical protein
LITDYHFYHLFGTLNNRASQYHDYGCVGRLRRQASAGAKRAPGRGREVVEGLRELLASGAAYGVIDRSFDRAVRVGGRTGRKIVEAGAIPSGERRADWN